MASISFKWETLHSQHSLLKYWWKHSSKFQGVIKAANLSGFIFSLFTQQQNTCSSSLGIIVVGGELIIRARLQYITRDRPT